MNWSVIWAAIKGLIGGLSDTNKWKMSVDGVPNAPVTAVKVGDKGIAFSFTAGGNAMTLEASAGNLQHATVKVNGTVDPNARLVFSFRHQFLKPLIVVFEFKNVVVDGTAHRYRFDNPK